MTHVAVSEVCSRRGGGEGGGALHHLQNVQKMCIWFAGRIIISPTFIDMEQYANKYIGENLSITAK